MKRFINQLIVLISLALLAVSCQKAPFLMLNSPRSFSFTNEGGSQSITFTCNRDWSVSSSESWIQVSPSSGTASDGEITVKITCAENTTYDARTATVTVKVEELTETISISQDTGLGLLVSPTTFDLTNAAQTIEIEVQKNVEYNISIDPAAREWITHTGTKGLTSEKLAFSIAANETYEDREGIIVFKQSGGPLFGMVVVEQTGYPVPEAVDLGLSIKWANLNIGANAPEDNGEYYAWGETETKSDYIWDTYKYGSGEQGPFAKYNTNNSYGEVDNRRVLETGPNGDDVASLKLGGKWRMPTAEELYELYVNCLWGWDRERNGYIVEGANGNRIFLPAGGRKTENGLVGMDTWGYYWSSSIAVDKPDYAIAVEFLSNTIGYRAGQRYCGHSIRPVSD